MKIEEATVAQLDRWVGQYPHLRVALEREKARRGAGGGESSRVAPGGAYHPEEGGLAAPAPASRPKPARKLPMPVGLVGLRREREGAVLRLTLFGPPRTKKNHGSRMMIGGVLKTVPSVAWREWRDALWRSGQLPSPVQLPAEPVNCEALFYRDRDAGDANGFYQGLADVLEEGGVVPDDKWIASWNGSLMLTDRGCPRVELTLTRLS